MSTRLNSVVSTGGIVAVGMMLGRFLGLLRESLIATYFGISGNADAAIFLLLLPDFITSVFIAGAGSAALLPAFAKRSDKKALLLMWQTLFVSVVAFLGIALIIILQASQIAGMFSMTDSSLSDMGMAVFFTAMSLPFMAATWVLTAWLQYRSRFVAPAFANTVFNIVILLTLLLSGADILALSIGSFIASLLRLATHIVAFIKVGGKIHYPASLLPVTGDIDKKCCTAYIRAVIIGMLGLLPIYVPYFMITSSSGELALFNYAFKLVLLPVVLLQNIIQTIILPLLVKHGFRGQESGISDQKKEVFRLLIPSTLIGSIAISLAVMFAAKPIAAICFGYGDMSADNVAEIAHLLRIGVWATPFVAMSCIWQQMLYAGHNTKSAMLASIVVTLLLFPVYWLGIRLGNNYGVMVSYVIISAISCVHIIIFGKKYITPLSLKRFIDIVIAAVTLVLLSPLLIIIATAIRLESKGSPLYFQERIGKDGKIFKMVKFRSMVAGADKIGTLWTQANDRRITHVGKFIRHTSLDELPQLWNVLIGEMSLVGPRPMLADAKKLFAAEDWRLRHSVPPGITGLAQVNGRSQITLDRQIYYDCEYARNWSIFMDIDIILKSFITVIRRRGVN